MYEDVASKDKQRYDEEVKLLTQNGQSLEELQKIQTKKPKKCLSAYMIFVKERRSKISDSNPGMPVLQIMKEVGKEWKALTKGREKYEKLAEVDKIRYQKQLKEFEKEVEKMRISSPKNQKNSPKSQNADLKGKATKRAKAQNLKRRNLESDTLKTDISEHKLKRPARASKMDNLNTVDTSSKPLFSPNRSRPKRAAAQRPAKPQKVSKSKNISNRNISKIGPKVVEKAVVLQDTVAETTTSPQTLGNELNPSNIEVPHPATYKGSQNATERNPKEIQNSSASQGKPGNFLPSKSLTSVDYDITKQSVTEQQEGVVLVESPSKAHPEISPFNKMRPPSGNREKRQRRLSSIVGIPTMMYTNEFDVENMLEDQPMATGSTEKTQANFFPQGFNNH